MEHLQFAIMSESSPEEHSAHQAPTAIFFIFFSCLLGALVRTLLKKVPYTLMLLILGALSGLLATYVPLVQEHTTLASMDPHTILNVFLPILIFESAFAMEAHTFTKSFIQIIILAIPGLVLASFLTAVFAMNVFNYQWGWNVAMLFGATVSATDPVAVVALLKDLGASKTLSTLIEGESLLNDGAAIVVFNVFQTLSEPGGEMALGDIALYFLRMSVGGPALGFVFAKLTTLWLVHIFNDAVTEITITLASTYLTFYVVEVWCGMSGVMAVVVLGLTLSAERTSISPEVEAFLHRFWEMLAYLANTLIFMLVGVVITEKALSSVGGTDWVLLIALYCAINVIRACIIALFSPLLKRIGYGLTWRSATVMAWGGLRGAVGLALALMVSQNSLLDQDLQDKVLFHTAGIVLLTLVLNATTMTTLLRILGMSEISLPKRIAMAGAVRNLQDVVQTSLSMYKTDRFLADADWDKVQKYVEVHDPYRTLDEEAELDSLTNYERTTECPVCEASVPNEPSAREWVEMRTEARLRMLKAKKTSYWRQFEHGMLSREAVRRLVECIDYATDNDNEFENTEEIKKSWEVQKYWLYMKRKLETWQSKKQDQTRERMPRQRPRQWAFIIIMHQVFEIILNVIIVGNIILIIVEIAVEAKYCGAAFRQMYGYGFEITNYCFILIYTVEAALKIVALDKQYFKSRWNLFDFVILVLSFLDIILEWAVFGGGKQCEDSSASTILNPSFLKMAKSIRLLRLLRSLRLVKGLIPQMIEAVNQRINKKLRFGYDVGKGYITGEEEVQNFIDVMIDNKKIIKEFNENVNRNRLVIMKELGQLQKLNPGIAVSIKTQQASRRILNTLRDKILSLRGEGVLDEGEAEKLAQMVEIQMKKLMTIASTIQAPPPEKIIGNLSWVSGDQQLIDYIKHNAVLVSLAEGEELRAESDPKGGIYVIISGLVQMDKYIEDHSREEALAQMQGLPPAMIEHVSRKQKDTTEPQLEKVTDYLSTGSVLGEMALLTGTPANVDVTCDTSVQLYQIPYDAIQAAIELFTEEPSLEYRLWRVCASRIAIVLLRKQIYFRTWSQEKIKLHLEKSILYLKKWDFPDGGRVADVTSFDITAMYMSDIILIHGVAENATSGDQYQGPCYVPNKVEHLLLLPGKTDKHVILIVPRDPNLTTNIRENETQAHKLHRVGAGESHASMTAINQLQAQRKESLALIHSNFNKNAAEYHSEIEATGVAPPASAMCLRHSAMQRADLTNRVSQHRNLMEHQSLASSVSSILHRKPSTSPSKMAASLTHADYADLEQAVTAAEENMDQAQICMENGPPARLPPLSGPGSRDTVVPQPPANPRPRHQAPGEEEGEEEQRASKVLPEVAVEETGEHLPPVEFPHYQVEEQEPPPPGGANSMA